MSPDRHPADGVADIADCAHRLDQMDELNRSILQRLAQLHDTIDMRMRDIGGLERRVMTLETGMMLTAAVLRDKGTPETKRIADALFYLEVALEKAAA